MQSDKIVFEYVFTEKAEKASAKDKYSREKVKVGDKVPNNLHFNIKMDLWRRGYIERIN